MMILLKMHRRTLALVTHCGCAGLVRTIVRAVALAVGLWPPVASRLITVVGGNFGRW
jgi:hypothetical protein